MSKPTQENMDMNQFKLFTLVRKIVVTVSSRINFYQQ